MKGTSVFLGGALLLAVAGGALLLAGLLERRLAVAQEDLLALDFADPEADYEALQPYVEYGGMIPWIAAGPLKEIRDRRAALRYWQGDYASLAASDAASSGPENQFMVASAMYRTAQGGPQDRATLLKALEQIIRAYGEVLQASPGHRDAAFNYEYVIRLRDELVAGRRKTLPTRTEGGDTPSDLKLDTELHGIPGAPPEDLKLKDFPILVPRESEELSNQDQGAGQGRTRRRRG